MVQVGWRKIIPGKVISKTKRIIKVAVKEWEVEMDKIIRVKIMKWTKKQCIGNMLRKTPMKLKGLSLIRSQNSSRTSSFSSIADWWLSRKIIIPRRKNTIPHSTTIHPRPASLSTTNSNRYSLTKTLQTRPFKHTVPLITLYSLSSCLNLPNYPLSSKYATNWLKCEWLSPP